MTTRRFPTAILGLLVLSAALLAAFVIPAVRTDRFPGATPGQAIPVLWIITGFSVVMGSLIVVLARTTGGPGSLLGRILTGVAALPTLLVAAALSDGALAYWSHGPEMHVASAAMFGSTAATALAGILTIGLALIRGKRPAGDDRPERPGT